MLPISKNPQFSLNPALPSSYGESISYEEEISRIKNKVNEVIDGANTLNDQKEDKDNITINRKLSEDGDFTGTLNGLTIEQIQNGESPIINEHTNELNAFVVIDNFNGNNDTIKFYNACQNAIANNKIIELTKDITLDASIYNQFEIPSIISKNSITITVIGALHLYIGNKCKCLKGFNIIDTNSYSKTDFNGTNKSQYDKGWLFETKQNFNIDGISISDIHFKGGADCIDGTYRTKGVFYLDGDNINIFNINISDSRSGFKINEPITNTITNYNIYVENVIFNNTEQGFWINSTSRIFLKNISIINSATQQTNYSCLAGSDLLNLLYCSNIQINKIYSNSVIERTIYFIQSNNVILDNFMIDNIGGGNGGGIKFYGILNVGSFNYPITNIKITNGIFSGIAKSSCFELYNAIDVEISNIKLNGNGLYDNFLLMSNNSKNISIDKCVIRNIKNNVLYGTLILSDTNYTYSHIYENISITNCEIINPVDKNASSPRSIIMFNNVNSQDLTNENFFKFYGLTFKNNKVIQTLDGINLYVNRIETTSKLTTLFDNAQPFKHVLYENNDIWGNNNPHGFLSVHTLSTDVIVKGDYYIKYQICVPYSITLYCSYGSEINFIQADTTGILKSKAIYNNVNGLTQSINNNISETTLSYSPNASEVKYLFHTNNGARMYKGIGEIYFSDGTYSKFKVVNNNGTLTIVQISGDGTVTNNNLTFTNGTQIIFGYTYKELRVVSGSTGIPYTITFKATV